MTYKLDNTPLSALGAFPVKGNNFFALEGMLDLPKRIGSTEYNWGTSIEPFVQSEDIQLDGRALTLHVAIRRDKVEAFKLACVACKTLSFDYDSFSVVCKDEIEVTPVGVYDSVKVKFWQNDFVLKPITIAPTALGASMIDNFNLSKDFGIHIARITNITNEAQKIDVNTTEFYIRTDYRGTREITLSCSMLGSSFADMYNKMNQFQSVLIKPGIRILTVRNNEFNVYFKDGITVSIAAKNILSFVLKAICI